MKNMVVANDALMGDFMGIKANKEYKAVAAPAAQIAGDALMGDFIDRKSTRLNSSHEFVSRMPSSA